MSILGPLGSGLKQHIREWTVEMNKLSAALEKLRLFWACFIWEGFIVTYFITLTLFITRVTCFFVFFNKLSMYLGSVEGCS